MLVFYRKIIKKSEDDGVEKIGRNLCNVNKNQL